MRCCDGNESNRWGRYFNPRTPLQSAIEIRWYPLASNEPFQSTHSITECDSKSNDVIPTGLNFNPRTPLQSAILRGFFFFWGTISIHALHYRVRSKHKFFTLSKILFQSTHSITECDPLTLCGMMVQSHIFQSTHSITECDRVTDPSKHQRGKFQSTHSITECDLTLAEWATATLYFNPRTPLQSAMVYQK